MRYEGEVEKGGVCTCTCGVERIVTLVAAMWSAVRWERLFEEVFLIPNLK